MEYELRFYLGGKHTINKNQDYNISGIYKLEETKNHIVFRFIKKAFFSSAYIPEKQDLKFSKNKNWTLEKLTTVFYPQQCGLPHWFTQIN